jgi:hypothetical protein
MITLDLSSAIAGCERVERRLREISNIMDHAGDLMENWKRLVEEGNRRGILEDKTDKDGKPLLRVTYRPFRARKLTIGERLGQRANLRRGRHAGKGSYTQSVLDNNNLSTSAYRRLAGPPLAPREQFSRVVTNFETTSWQVEEHGHWIVMGAWKEVVNKNGYAFLKHLFDGDPPQPGPRDLRGVRPKDLEKCRATILPWAKLKIRELWNETD